jgi:hypothetical protein
MIVVPGAGVKHSLSDQSLPPSDSCTPALRVIPEGFEPSKGSNAADAILDAAKGNRGELPPGPAWARPAS